MRCHAVFYVTTKVFEAALFYLGALEMEVADLSKTLVSV
jgi:hypothetical protein